MNAHGIEIQTVSKSDELGAKAKWNHEADQYNQWDSLGDDEKSELISAFSDDRKRSESR